ncbi:DOMON domain-containing protein [Aphelenchoides besseyi]|nr:DOMON domain-containing protein [Aphelenchoides besseyi]
MVTLRTLTFVCLVAVISIRNVAGKCQFSHGNYKLEWAVDKKNVVHFLLTYRNYPTGANSWTGVAFGEGMMYGLDAIVVRNMNDQISVSDEFVQGYGPSSTDGTQDVKTKSAKLDGGVLKVQFSRPADTPDRQFDLPLSGCKTLSPASIICSDLIPESTVKLQ